MTNGIFIARAIAVLLAIALIWMVVAKTWQITGARSAASVGGVALLTADAAANEVIAANLFRDRTSPAGSTAPAQAFDFRLKGVYAPRFAIVSSAGQADRNVMAGEEIQAGARLHAVFSDHVLVMTAAGPVRVDLDAVHGGMAMAPGITVPDNGTAAIALSRVELEKMHGDPGQQAGLAQLGSYPAGGIVVNDASPGSLAAKLRLRQGDVVQRINDQPITGKEDLLRIAERPGPNAMVTIDALRGGEPIRVMYSFQP